MNSSQHRSSTLVVLLVCLNCGFGCCTKQLPSTRHQTPSLILQDAYGRTLTHIAELPGNAQEAEYQNLEDLAEAMTWAVMQSGKKGDQLRKNEMIVVRQVYGAYLAEQKALVCAFHKDATDVGVPLVLLSRCRSLTRLYPLASNGKLDGPEGMFLSMYLGTSARVLGDSVKSMIKDEVATRDNMNVVPLLVCLAELGDEEASNRLANYDKGVVQRLKTRFQRGYQQVGQP